MAWKTIDEARIYSETRLARIREVLSQKVPEGALVVTCGSYARREASPNSDMDYYVIVDDVSADAQWIQDIKQHIGDVVGKLPAEDGAFAARIIKSELLRDYGGHRDSNETITRRMLYLLEGEYLTEPENFVELRRMIIDRYVKNTPKDNQVAFYLLNDVIRYWRTMAVDYAQKTYGADKPKPWAIRNIKLIYSRKVIYASGIFSIALTADRTAEEKSKILERLFSMNPLDRIAYVCGAANCERLFQMYDRFLETISNKDVRDHLEDLKVEDREKSDIFRNVKNEGHYFSRELMGLLDKTFHSSHPIHMAVIF